MADDNEGDDSYGDDEEFVAADITTIDPGYSIIIATAIFCVCLYFFLPCLVSFGNRMDQKKREERARERGDYPTIPKHAEDDTGALHTPDRKGKLKSSGGSPETAESFDDDAASFSSKGSYASSLFGSVIDAAHQSRKSRRKALEKRAAELNAADGMLVPTELHVTKQNTSDVPSSVSNVPDRKGKLKSAAGSPETAESDKDDDEVSRSSKASVSVSSLLGPVMDAGQNKGGRRARRRALEKRQAELSAVDGSHVPTELCLTHQNASDAGSIMRVESELGSIGHDEVSFHDAIDGSSHIRKKSAPDAENITCCGRNAWWKPRTMARCFDKLLSVAEFDYETKRIYRLAWPFVLQAMLEGFFELARVAIVGRLMGTKELAAYLVVDLLVGLSGEFLGGLIESIATLASHSIGTGNRKLTGQYVQLAIVLYVLFSIPVIIMWIFLIERTIMWFGYDEEIAAIGFQFAIPILFTEVFEGVLECFHELLDVIDRQIASTVLSAVGEIAVTLPILFATLFWNPTLQTIGFIYLIASVVELVLTVAFIHARGWIRRYYCGLFRSCALSNGPAIRMMLKTSSALSFGQLLAYGEWEVLTFFAAALGPAEVAAWALLDGIWETLEDVTEAVADASEVRCAYLMGSGQPDKARLSSNKSIFIGFVFSLMITSILFIAGDDLPTWFTSNANLQSIVADLIPLIGLGNIALTMGTMAWTLVGSQGRYRLATVIGTAGCWLVTVPLAAVLSVGFNINLKGQTAAVVLGYMISGTINTYILLRSDWKKLSDQVIEYNKENNIELSDDGSSSSSSSSSSNSESGSTPRKSLSIVELNPSDRWLITVNSAEESGTKPAATEEPAPAGTTLESQLKDSTGTNNATNCQAGTKVDSASGSGSPMKGDFV